MNKTNDNMLSFNEIVKQQNIEQIIQNQKTLKILITLVAILVTILIAIVVFIIVKFYPYLDTLKEYYQLLDNMKQWIN